MKFYLSLSAVQHPFPSRFGFCVLAVSGLLMLAACGQKGSLYLRDSAPGGTSPAAKSAGMPDKAPEKK